MNPTDTSTGRVADERESAVLGQTALTAIVVVIYASLVAAIGLALLGQLLAPAVFLLFAGLPAWVLMPLAERRFVDTGAIVAGAPARRTLVAATTVVVGMLLALGAMAWTIHTGHGLLGLPDITVAGPDASGAAASLARGAVYGAAGAVVVLGVVVAVTTARRRASRP
jgi:hypothetical protein